MGSFEALIVLAIAILPGAMYTWAFERQMGSWGAGATDRIYRFIGVSAVLLAFAAYPAHVFFRSIIHRLEVVGGEVSFANLITGGLLPSWAYVAPILYLAVPGSLGWLAGAGVRRQQADGRRRWWVTILVGRDPAPLAWDHVFSSRPSAVVRLQLVDGSFLGGYFGGSSYASGYPHGPGDLYLEKVYRMRGDGSFEAGPEGGFEELGSGALVRWDQVRMLEMFPGDQEVA